MGSYKSDYDAGAAKSGGKAADKGSYRGKVEQGNNDQRAADLKKVVNQNIKTEAPKKP